MIAFEGDKSVCAGYFSEASMKQRTILIANIINDRQIKISLYINRNIIMLELTDKGFANLKQKDLGDPKKVQHLDLSGNLLSKGIQLAPLTNLITLVIDDNRYTTLIGFPALPRLQTLSANKNQFSDLYQFLDEGSRKFERLKNLSLLKNPVNPFFQGEDKYSIFRQNILEVFKGLITLDGCSVTIIQNQLSKRQKKQEQQYEKLTSQAMFDEKYTHNQVKSVKTRSEGHRFVKNNQL